MRRLVLRFVIAVSGMGIILLSLALAERQFGKRRLSRALEAIERAGETLNVAAFRPPAVPDAANGWLRLLAYTNRLATVPEAIREPLPLWQWAGPGRLLSLGAATNGADPSVAAREMADAVGSLSNALAGETELRQAIHQAMAQPDFDGGFPYQMGFFEMPGETTVLVSAARWLHAEACLGLIDRNAVDYQQALVSQLRLLRHQRRQPMLIGQLTRYSFVLKALALTVRGLESPRFLSLADLKELRDGWAGFNVVADLQGAMRMERAVALQHFRILATNSVRRAEAFGFTDEVRKIMDMDEEPAGQRVWRTCVQEPLWPWLWMDHDLAWSLTHWNHRIEAADRARSASWKAAALEISALDVRSGFRKDVPMEGVQAPSWADRARCRSGLGGPNLFSDHFFFLSAYRAETARRLAVAALHVYGFHRDHARWPVSLSEAGADTGGGEETLDPMDGQPLRYRRLKDEDGFLLYSVGTDGVDDGGSAEMENPDKPYRILFDGVDWVWPRGSE